MKKAAVIEAKKRAIAKAQQRAKKGSGLRGVVKTLGQAGLRLEKHDTLGLGEFQRGIAPVVQGKKSAFSAQFENPILAGLPKQKKKKKKKKKKNRR